MAYIKSNSVSGFRSFGPESTVFRPAIPNGAPGSGLSLIVGPNSAGKTALLESISLTARGPNQELPEVTRHDATDYQAAFVLQWVDGYEMRLNSGPDGKTLVGICRTPGGEGKDDTEWPKRGVMCVNPTRELPSEVTTDRVERLKLLPRRSLGAARAIGGPPQVRWAEARSENRFREKFNSVVDLPVKLFTEGSAPWVSVSGHKHEPRGLGHGIASVFHIVDALHDAREGDVVIIDEPEVALHPYYQRRVLDLLMHESARTQIICATHSPYFAQWKTLFDGASLFRVARAHGYSRVFPLQDKAIKAARKLDGIRSPHVLGISASEVFFLPDCVILVEGQDDVIYYRKMASGLGIDLDGEFFGWGVGGADNMQFVAGILGDLGYSQVFGILDANKAALIPDLKERFPSFEFTEIPTHDVRDKPDDGINGLCDGRGTIHDEWREPVQALFCRINTYFQPEAGGRRVEPSPRS